MNNPKIKYIIKFISVWLVLTFLFIVVFGIIMSLNIDIGLDSKDFPIIIASCLIAGLIASPLYCKVADVCSSSIGIKKSELLLTENISKSRKIFISSVVFCRKPSCNGILFLTEAGVEVYSGKYALKKINFYISWKDINNINSHGRKLVIKTANEKKQTFLVNNKHCSAEMIEEACTKYRDQIKDTGVENL